MSGETLSSGKTMNDAKDCNKLLTALSQILLVAGTHAVDTAACPAEYAASLSNREFAELWRLATSHHVIMRTFPVLLEAPGRESALAESIRQAMIKEEARIAHALPFLAAICSELESAGDVTVIKSLDHWPDIGTDLDLFTNAKSADVIGILRTRFNAEVADRSWGDRLANKWNFIVPGLPELVEVHVARLGQTGEQTAITGSLLARSSAVQFADYTFKVPAAEDRIIISTLQRMYRHFYIRLCDLADNAGLLDAAAIDFHYLNLLASTAGLWEGVATYLVVVSGYVEAYRHRKLPLPSAAIHAARFGVERLRFDRNFLRIPIFPQSAKLYLSELKALLLQGKLRSTLRLSLLPGLATAAAVEFKLTGSDKGIW